ncbi:MAG: hypothetical protein ACE5H3_09295 [Planctomycetota bacterium]
MIPFLLLLPLPAPLPRFQAGPAEDPVQVAVLASGARVECLPGASSGDLSLATPFGRLETPVDPVAEVADASGEVRLLRAMRAADPKAWVDRAARRGLLGELVAEADSPKPHLTGDAREALFAELEKFGARLDPVPARVPWEDRTGWLWKRIAGAPPGEGALLTGRLLSEIPAAEVPSDRRLGLADLRRGLRARNPALRRAAAAAALRQKERDLRLPLLQTSLEDPQEPVRLAGARALAGIDPAEALGRWTLALWRDRREPPRLRSAGYLGRFGNEKTVDALMVPLAASSNGRSPGAFIFAGRQVSIVRDFDVEVAQAAAIADPVVDVLSEGSVLQVRVLSVRITQSIVRSLERLTGAHPGPRASDWVRWYETRRKGAPATDSR